MDVGPKLFNLIDYDQIAKHYVLMSSSHTKVRGGPSSLEEFDPTK